MSTSNKYKQELSDLKKIIKIQEKIIEKKESEIKQVHKLFIQYNEKSVEGWSWYGQYYRAYNNLLTTIQELKSLDKDFMEDLEQTLLKKHGGSK